MYAKYKSVFQAVSRKSKEWTYMEIYENNYKDAKKIWELTNKLLSRKQREKSNTLSIMNEGSLVTESKEVANLLNNHFVNMGKNIAETFEKNEKDPILVL